ncbi:MAG: hypothetical protein ACO1SV_10025 [Fimbriimonas sp.]
MGKGRYLKSAERACSGKARFDTAQDAERTSEYRYRAYACPVCHGFHLTSRGGAALSPEPPAPPKSDPKGAKLGDLDWSALLEPDKPKPTRPPKPVKPKPAPLPPPRLARCTGPCGKDGRAPMVLDGRLVKSARVRFPGLRSRIAKDVEVSLGGGDPPEILEILYSRRDP